MSAQLRHLNTRFLIVTLALLWTTAFLAACGGGGGGGGKGGSSSTGSSGNSGISLSSIVFPASTNLSGGGTAPPDGAPLGQQVVFNFTGTPMGPDIVVLDEPPIFDALQVYAIWDSEYTGPEVVVDHDRNIIPARGTFEKMGDSYVFTPYFPTAQIDLSSNAQLEAVPGLLPDMEYIVFVPIGVGGTIANLKGIEPFVSNPVRFTTCSEDLENLYYSNHPAEPPLVVDHNPADGATNVPVNTYDDSIPGFPAQEQFTISFDQPLQSSNANVQGSDLDGDQVEDDSMYFMYTAPEAYAALDAGTTKDAGIYTVNRVTGAATRVGKTSEDIPPYDPVGLNSVVIDGGGRMLGSSGDTLYSVEYRNPDPLSECTLSAPLALDGRTEVVGLALGWDGTLYALDSAADSLVTIDPGTGAVSDELALATTEGDYMDLAVGADGHLYALSVRDSGTPGAWTTVQEILLDDGSVATVFTSAGDYTSIGMAGYSRAALYSGPGLFVDMVDLEAGQTLPGENFVLAGDLDDGSLLDITDMAMRLGTYVSILNNSYTGSTVALQPSGILPFGERVELLVRRGLNNISLGNLAEHPDPQVEARKRTESILVGTFTTFDPGPAVISDRFLEEFLDTTWEANAMQEGLSPAIWAVDDVDGEDPEYEHLLATYGLGGGGTLGDFKPLEVFPSVLLDTDYQKLPLYDGSTPGVRKPTVVIGGVFNFRNIDIPAGVTVKGVGNNPLILTATGSVNIAGTIDISGDRGMDDVTFNSAFTPTPGASGGPGGGRGGDSQPTWPQSFQLLTDLRSPKSGDPGWGYSNLRRIGGQGGESGAKGTNVPFLGSDPDDDSRGAGGGGGSYYQVGGNGYHGMGGYQAVPENSARYLPRDEWEFNDGAPEGWPGEHVYMTDAPPGGDPGEHPFNDEDDENNFIGPGGELTFLRGGQGGGGAGSRLDSMNPGTIGAAAGFNPPVDRSAYDSKGGGGGGGGGGLAIYALGEIVLQNSAFINGRGGQGGGGEVIGHSSFGGGAGGGSGGAVILDSATRIHIMSEAQIDVSGGWPGEAKEVAWQSPRQINWTAHTGNNCLDPKKKHQKSFCQWSIGDGGVGGYGMVQLQVPDPDNPAMLQIDNPNSIFAELCKVDWHGEYWGAYAVCNGGGPNCIDDPPENCQEKFYHYKVIYSPNAELPRTHDDPEEECLVPPEKTPTTLGPLSFGLSKWIDLGQVVTRDKIGGLPTPVFLGFEGIDTASGTVLTTNGYVLNPDDNDIEVFAPDWDGGRIHYIPEENEVNVMFQGADPYVAGSRTPDPDSYTDWTADITDLNGKQFIRFRVGFNTAVGQPLSPTSPKPQVNFVRLRMQY